MKRLVSRHATDLISHQVALADKYLDAEQEGKPFPTCTGKYRTSIGIPCAHMINDLRKANQLIRLRHFHPHWRLGTEEELESWIQVASDRVGEVETSHTTLYDYTDDVEEDADIILNPPTRSRKRLTIADVPSGSVRPAKSTRRPSQKSQASQQCPDVLPTGRISTLAERAVGVPQARRPCLYCNSKQHEFEDCISRRADEDRQDAEEDVVDGGEEGIARPPTGDLPVSCTFPLSSPLT